MNDYPQHCDRCGAYLSTLADQTLHAEWHTALERRLQAVATLAHKADAHHRPYGGGS